MISALFIGDSITEGFNLNAYFPGERFVNHGISGFSSEEVLGAIDKSWFEKHPRHVFICIGTNDLARSIDLPEIIGNLRQLIVVIKEITAAETVIYLTSLFPTRHNPPRPNTTIDKLNELVHQLSLEQQVMYLHLNPFFRDHNGQLCRHFTDDGLHLNDYAYKRWKELLLMLIKP